VTNQVFLGCYAVPAGELLMFLGKVMPASSVSTQYGVNIPEEFSRKSLLIVAHLVQSCCLSGTSTIQVFPEYLITQQNRCANLKSRA
jgi:hypothetical protein